MNRKRIKLLSLLTAFSLVGCAKHRIFTGTILDPIAIIANENIELNNMTPRERCEHIRVDLREDCRNNYNKEVDEMAAAMQRKN